MLASEFAMLNQICKKSKGVGRADQGPPGFQLSGLARMDGHAPQTVDNRALGLGYCLAPI